MQLNINIQILLKHAVIKLQKKHSINSFLYEAFNILIKSHGCEKVRYLQGMQICGKQLLVVVGLIT